MSTQSEIYKLVNPQLTDAADITNTNVNWGIIENELQALNVKADNNTGLIGELRSELTGQITELSRSVNNTINGLDAKITNQTTTHSADKSELNNKITNNTTEIGKVRTEFATADNNLRTLITSEVAKLQPKITYGTAAPSGGNNGDIYIQLI